MNRITGMMSEERILGNKINVQRQYPQSIQITGLEWIRNKENVMGMKKLATIYYIFSGIFYTLNL